MLGRFSVNECNWKNRGSGLASLWKPCTARFEISPDWIVSFVLQAKGPQQCAQTFSNQSCRRVSRRVVCSFACVCVCVRFWWYFLKLGERANEPARSFAFRVTDSSITRGWIRFPRAYSTANRLGIGCRPHCHGKRVLAFLSFSGYHDRSIDYRRWICIFDTDRSQK